MSVFRNVLVGLDLDEATAGIILNRACQIAEPSEIEAVHACNHLHEYYDEYPIGSFSTSEDLDRAVRSQADNFLIGVCEPLGITRHRVLDGRAASALHDYAREHADLIVVGSHGRHGFAAMFGSTSNQVLHGTECDVLAVHLATEQQPEPKDYSRVLAAIDLSEEAIQVLDHAQAIATAVGAKLLMCHVTHQSASAMPESELGQLAHFGNAYGLDDDDIFELDGNTTRVIHQLAEDVDADLLVVGTHGKHGLELIPISTANSVLHGATCDALSVKIKRD